MQMRPALFVVVGVLVACQSAFAIDLTPTSAPLPGSGFQGGDGNQADDSGFVDWQDLQAAGRVIHRSDPPPVPPVPPPVPDVIFKAGSRPTEPATWDLTTSGNVPAKADVTNAWATVDQVGAGTFVYLAFSRKSTSGDSHLAFELNRDGRLWDNGNASIPCRRTGDLIVNYDVGTNGAASVGVDRWTTTTADPATGCAATGTFSPASRAITTDDVQGAMSPALIDNYLPGEQATMAAGEFGEVALNLSRIADDSFGSPCLAFTSIWLRSRSSQSVNSSLQDYVDPAPLDVRHCTASGTKFLDANANGVRDPAEPALSQFLVWADYNNDGVFDQPTEPFALTDAAGNYVIYDIHGTYTLRETLLPRPVANWRCTSPTTRAPGGGFVCGWGPIDPNATPNVTGLDFGNFRPATLEIRKIVRPAGDSTKFDVTVQASDGTVVGTVVVGDADSEALTLPAGTYTVTERPPPGSTYKTAITCSGATSGAPVPPIQGPSAAIQLAAGRSGECAIANVLPGTAPVPAVQIIKTGPSEALAGVTLKYKLLVINPGEVPFAEANVKVTDPGCDAAPQLGSKFESAGAADGSPNTLDPGDLWTYRCSRTTVSGGSKCKPRNVPNTASVAASDGSATVSDKDDIVTALTCPGGPPQPEPTPPNTNPSPPNTSAPSGKEPLPPAGESGAARTAVLGRITRGCFVSRHATVVVRGDEVAAVRVAVNGRLRRTVRLGILARATRIPITLPPGRSRVSARVAFHLGSGTPSVVEVRSVRTCAQAKAARPRFTG